MLYRGLMTVSAAPIFTSTAAQILGVSEATVRLWEGTGRLKAIRTDRGVRLFDRAACEQLARELAERRQVGLGHEALA
jgi:DNA-binding transcriptional MerR regulator